MVRIVRLRQIYTTVVECTLEIRDPKANASGNTVTVANWKSFLGSYLQLQKIEMFENMVKGIYNISPIITSHESEINLTSGQYNEFNIKNTKLVERMEAIIALCRSIDIEEHEDGIDIKLPYSKDFSEFTSNIQELDRFFKICPVFNKEDGKLELAGSDVGSTWLLIALGGPSVVLAIGKIVEAAMKIKSMYLTCEQQKEVIKKNKEKNKLLEKITEMYDEMISATSIQLAKDLKDDDESIASDIEEEGKLAKSLDCLGKLMSKGLEVYAAIESTDEVKAVFPSIEQQKLPKEVTKLLSEQK